MIIPSRGRLPVTAGAAAAVLGTCAAFHYHWLGLTLSHYDARGHLVVARRIVDSLTPGWQQIGAVWLPLPHLLNAMPVQLDAWYRSGLSAVVLSVLAFAIACAAVAWIAQTLTGSHWAGAASALVFGLNPNVLYLQSTPMTEPLFLACTLVAVARLIAWCRGPAAPFAVGAWFAAACLTRFEAWPITAAALAAAVWVRWRAGCRPADALREIAPVALPPAVTALAFMAFSRIVVGEWFVSGGFFVPDPKHAGAIESVRAIVAGLSDLTSTWAAGLASVGVVAMVALGLSRRAHAHWLVALALAGGAAVPWYAFWNGHPYRIRYMVPLVAIEAIGAGAAVGLARRAAPALTALVAAVAIAGPGPFDRQAPMVVEAQWDRPTAALRATVSACLARDYDGRTIMASMGSLGHYMQELSHEGFLLRDFLHEGNGDIWLNALDGPRPYVGWILIEEVAEGGDMLAERARGQPRFLDGFRQACRGGGVTLYRRVPEPDMSPASGTRGGTVSGSARSQNLTVNVTR